ncbi:fasciclin-like arabinogalactan protein 17 [Cynara cardunculus var. scolymus]|uniref:fasciclin-like arabinogalactan protein 17 n=1 Tax=Cynara cardunculus var. scolymus TaxID=59895 RepID=UPI000D623382|nr:fasciclin-like arabinogalactan protein 17 [Cynara cardunculus var. scolymus]XP_024986371.1 fasciclin-like arabinogalactan protein 17 [Cynara cardunculus var. scolymus]XP_024986372.1 fasciclin-like arabinogalactan protein 17 [Cynara cardunculus var. scolymus]
MDSQIYGALGIFLFIFYLIPPAAINATQLPTKSSSAQINSNSVLVALLDSHYTELSELVEKALLLQTLEEAVSHHNITIFAPSNEALERHLDPEFKRFLLQPGNLKSLQNLLLFHIIPSRVGSKEWPGEDLESVAYYETLCIEEVGNHLPLTRESSGDKVVGGLARVTRPDDVIREDGLIHGIERLLVPRLVQEDFNRRRSLSSISAVLPEGAPVVDPRTNRLKKPATPVPAGAPPALPVYDAMAPGPSLAPAPAPGPGGPRHHFDGESQVKDFIQTLLHYGGYNELADILVNLTSLATEMGKLVSEGYVLTVLAPNDEAMAKLTTDQLSDPGAPEQIIYYHLIPEYQTEESMYNSVRRFGKVQYDTLRLPHKVVAEEADGSVKFGQGEEPAYLFDPDIYTDGRISVQGIDGVLFPPEQTVEKPAGKVGPPSPAKVVAEPKRGKLLEVACSIVGAFGQDSQFTSCY